MTSELNAVNASVTSHLHVFTSNHDGMIIESTNPIPIELCFEILFPDSGQVCTMLLSSGTQPTQILSISEV